MSLIIHVSPLPKAVDTPTLANWTEKPYPFLDKNEVLWVPRRTKHHANLCMQVTILNACYQRYDPYTNVFGRRDVPKHGIDINAIVVTAPSLRASHWVHKDYRRYFFNTLMHLLRTWNKDDILQFYAATRHVLPWRTWHRTNIWQTAIQCGATGILDMLVKDDHSIRLALRQPLRPLYDVTETIWMKVSKILFQCESVTPRWWMKVSGSGGLRSDQSLIDRVFPWLLQAIFEQKGYTATTKKDPTTIDHWDYYRCAWEVILPDLVRWRKWSFPARLNFIQKYPVLLDLCQLPFQTPDTAVEGLGVLLSEDSERWWREGYRVPRTQQESRDVSRTAIRELASLWFQRFGQSLLTDMISGSVASPPSSPCLEESKATEAKECCSSEVVTTRRLILRHLLRQPQRHLAQDTLVQLLQLWPEAWENHPAEFLDEMATSWWTLPYHNLNRQRWSLQDLRRECLSVLFLRRLAMIAPHKIRVDHFQTFLHASPCAPGHDLVQWLAAVISDLGHSMALPVPNAAKPFFEPQKPAPPCTAWCHDAMMALITTATTTEHDAFLETLAHWAAYFHQPRAFDLAVSRAGPDTHIVVPSDLLSRLYDPPKVLDDPDFAITWLQRRHPKDTKSPKSQKDPVSSAEQQTVQFESFLARLPDWELSPSQCNNLRLLWECQAWPATELARLLRNQRVQNPEPRTASSVWLFPMQLRNVFRFVPKAYLQNYFQQPQQLDLLYFVHLRAHVLDTDWKCVKRVYNLKVPTWKRFVADLPDMLQSQLSTFMAKATEKANSGKHFPQCLDVATILQEE